MIPYRIDIVTLDIAAGAPKSQALLQLAQAALDHGRATMKFNELMITADRDRILDMIEETGTRK